MVVNGAGARVASLWMDVHSLACKATKVRVTRRDSGALMKMFPDTLLIDRPVPAWVTFALSVRIYALIGCCFPPVYEGVFPF
jgi:hypothetical protein